MSEETGSVIAAVLKRAGLYLVCRRPLQKRHGGKWEFPGGKVEIGETLFDAARRELAEELALDVTSCGVTLFSVKDELSGYTINFVEVAAKGEPVLHEHLEYRFQEIRQLAALDLAPSDYSFVRFLQAKLPS